MTRSEYQQAVADFFATESITCLSIDIENCEPYFSKQSCDCCRSHLPGDRYDVLGYNPETQKILKYSFCLDCLYYAEYEQLDDMTMMDMEEYK